MLNGFKNYFESGTQAIRRADGLAELARLEKGHYLIAVPADYEKTMEYLQGADGLRHIDKDMVVTAERIGHMANTVGETLMVIPIPKRWFTRPQLETKGVTGAIGELLPLSPGWKLPANYVWGYFSKWNEDHEALTDGQFFRNSSYHGHDGLYNIWKKKIASPKSHESLDRPTPRVTAPYSPHGNKTFHGYSSAFEN